MITFYLIQQVEGKAKVKFGEMVSLDHVKSSFSVVMKPRPDGSRPLVILLLALFGLYTLSKQGEKKIWTPYVKKKFIWSDETVFNDWVSEFNSLANILASVASGLLMPLFSRVVNDFVLILVCLTSLLLNMFITLTADVLWVLYFAAVAQMFQELTGTPIRAMLTKIVSSGDTGKVNESI